LTDRSVIPDRQFWTQGPPEGNIERNIVEENRAQSVVYHFRISIAACFDRAPPDSSLGGGQLQTVS
jgi:hypothetical protein